MVNDHDSPRRGMVFRSTSVWEPGDGPTHFTCRAECGDGMWADPAWGSPPRPFSPATMLRIKAWAFDGVDPAYVDPAHLGDIATFGISPRADLTHLVGRLKDLEDTVRMQLEILSGSPEATFTKDGIGLSGHLVGMFAAAHEHVLVESGAKNFMVMSFVPKTRPGHIYVTLRWSEGETVESMWLKQGARIDTIAYLAQETEKAHGRDTPYAAGLRKALSLLGRDPNAALGQLPSGRRPEDIGIEVTAPGSAAHERELSYDNLTGSGDIFQVLNGSAGDEDAPACDAYPALNANHIIFDMNTGEMVCEVCKARKALPVPIPLGDVTGHLVRFAEAHAACAPASGDPS